MTDTFKTPLQEIQSITDKGFLDILETDDSYIAYFSDQDSISGDKTVLGALSPYSSCARLKDFLWKSVTTFYDINPRSIAGESYRVFCDMELAGGWWTLIATSAEDWVNTWTYHNTIDSGVANIFNKDPIGNIEDYKQDFKSQAYGDIKFKDVLFVDKQWVWWAYDDVQLTRAFTMDDFIPRELSCPYEWTGRSYKLTSWSVSQNKWLLGEQQDRALFFTVRDNEQWCDENRIGHKWSHDAYGPTWWYGRNSLLSPDDPGLVGWWPSRTYGVLDSLWTWSMIGPKKPGVECRDARLGTKKVDFSICNSNDGDYILWFVR